MAAMREYATTTIVTWTLGLAAALSSQLLPSADAAVGRGSATALPPGNCTTTVCGDVIVPYPFGLTAGCYLPRFFPVCSIFPESFYTTDMQEQIFCVFDYFPVSLSITDKET